MWAGGCGGAKGCRGRDRWVGECIGWCGGGSLLVWPSGCALLGMREKEEVDTYCWGDSDGCHLECCVSGVE